MSKRRKEKPVRIIQPSRHPLPDRLAPLYVEQVQVFCDASRLRHGGLAAVLFETPASEALIRTSTVEAIGSNELELQAALFALEQARQLFPGRPLALFSDNQDAVNRLNRSIDMGLAQDPVLQQMLDALGMADALSQLVVCWVKGHASCRGNIVADEHATRAAA